MTGRGCNGVGAVNDEVGGVVHVGGVGHIHNLDGVVRATSDVGWDAPRVRAAESDISNVLSQYYRSGLPVCNVLGNVST